jgi:hypothetical protein
MTADPALLSALAADAIRNAGATEEIIAALLSAGGTFDHVPCSKGGRPRRHSDRASKDRAYRERKKARVETYDETQPHAWTPKRRALLEAFSRPDRGLEDPWPGLARK